MLRPSLGESHFLPLDSKRFYNRNYLILLIKRNTAVYVNALSINASCLGLCRISAALAHLQSAGVGWNINSQMVFVGDGALSQHMRTVFLGLSDCMLRVSINKEMSVCNITLENLCTRKAQSSRGGHSRRVEKMAC